jgi:hypothetical protein
MNLYSLAPLVLIGVLLSGLPPGAHDGNTFHSPAIVTPAGVDAQDYESLLAEYTAAQSKHQDDLADAKSLDERAKLLKKNPVQKFWRKFDRIAKSDVRGLLWLLDHVDDKEPDAKKNKKIRSGLAKRILKSDVTSADFGGVMRLLKDLDSLGEDDILALYDKVLAQSSHADVKAQALYRKAWLFKRSSKSARKEQFDGLIELCAMTYGGTRYGTLAHAAIIKASDLEEGKPAPNFYAETLEGHGFKLSDYKGKIVLLDFYGFW